MKVALTVIALALTAGVCDAAPLPVRLEDGATWRQTVVHRRVDERRGRSQDVTVTTIVEATYRAGGQPTATIEQRFVSMSSDQLSPHELATLVEQSKLVYPAMIEVDEALTPTRVINWSKLRENALAVVADQDAKAAGAVREMFGNIDDRGAAVFFKEQALVSLGQGTDLKVGESVRYEDEVPNILGGPPIKSHGEFILVSHDAAKRRAVVTWSQALDPDSAAASIRASIEALVARAGADAEKARKELAGFSMKRDDACSYEIDTRTGLAARTECSVALVGGAGDGEMRRLDHWIITQSSPEVR